MKRQQMAQEVTLMTKRITTIASIACTVIGLSSIIASAGNLYPPGPPAPTMRTMEQLKPAWDKIIPGDQRFVGALLYQTHAQGLPTPDTFLDKETGLVWAAAPDSTPRTWQEAMFYCATLNLGGRMGWRLPTIEELASLVDLSNPGSLKLPVGAPFQNVQGHNSVRGAVSSYWSSSSSPLAGSVYGIDLGLGVVASYLVSSESGFVWPVRSGQ